MANLSSATDYLQGKLAASGIKTDEAPNSIIRMINDRLGVDDDERALVEEALYIALRAQGYSANQQLELFIRNTIPAAVSDVNMRTRRAQVASQVIPARLAEIDIERVVLGRVYERKNRIWRALGERAFQRTIAQLGEEEMQIYRYSHALPSQETIGAMNTYLVSNPDTLSALYDEAKLLCDLDTME